MSYQEKRDLLEAERMQNEKAVEVIAELQDVDSNIDNSVAKIDKLLESGLFDLVADEIKAPAIAALNAVKNLQIALQNTAIQEMLNWRK